MQARFLQIILDVGSFSISSTYTFSIYSESYAVYPIYPLHMCPTQAVPTSFTIYKKRAVIPNTILRIFYPKYKAHFHNKLSALYPSKFLLNCGEYFIILSSHWWILAAVCQLQLATSKMYLKLFLPLLKI